MAEQYEVFVSYSHDTPEHISAVRELSDRLREDGIDCILDQYEHSPPEGWPRWMDGKIRACRYVLMVCTEAYCRRVMGTEAPGVGHGVQWEGNLIYQLFVKGTQPFVSLMRLITPRFVLDRHLPYAACALLAVAWVGLSIGKLQMCGENPQHRACEALTSARGTGPAAAPR